MSSEWQDVDAVAKMRQVQDWLDSKGLGKYGEKIVEVTEVTCLDDFKLIDATMAEEVIQSLQLKLVTAQKFRQAVAEARTGAPCEADSWAVVSTCEAQAPVPPPPAEVPAEVHAVQEVIAICIDRSGSMGTPFAEVTLNVVRGETRDSVAERTRMEAVKAMFYAFRDRVESMGAGKYHLGLLQFDNQVEKLLDTTPALDRFESIVDDMKKRGQTAIYSSILEATEMLKPYFSPSSPVDLRILVLTDGQNNAGAAPEAALEAVNAVGATVDAILVGDNPDADLRRIVSATEGECYQIRHLGEGFELLESEAVVSLKARRGGTEKPAFRPRARDVSFRSIQERQITQGSHVPRVQDAGKDHLAKAKVVSMSAVDHCSKGSLGAPAAKRVLSELKQLSSTALEGIHVFPSEDISFWRALMEGPAGTPFEGGVFALDVFLPSDYPFKPPEINFQTPIYHCNVNANGKICLDILKNSWHPSLTVAKCLQHIRELVISPNPEDALRQWIAELTLVHQRTNGADTRYFDNARESTMKDASLSIEGWQAKWAAA
ncbi:unnamed protein product [Effrenium voratum]|nr:unnamed protein product [Effrenium voratum]